MDVTCEMVNDVARAGQWMRPQGQVVYGDLEPLLDLPPRATYRWASVRHPEPADVEAARAA
jgi:hypothetical protein